MSADLYAMPEDTPEARAAKLAALADHRVHLEQVAPKEGRSPLNWAKLEACDPSPRRWAIAGWWGFGHSTLMPGIGGIGKTLLAQQIGSCLALGRDFIGSIAGPLRVLMWACEDDADELWRRQLDIAAWLQVPLSAFDNLVIEPRVGKDNTLVAAEFGKMVVTPLIEELREQVNDYRVSAVILDNVAQLYGASENERHSVTYFLNTLTGTLGADRALLLLAHPARSQGSEFAGSGAWEAVVRTRLYLGSKLPDAKGDEEDEPDDSVRYLCRRKANYASKDFRRFQYQNGVLVPDEVEASGGIVDHLRAKQAERVIVDAFKKLREMGMEPADSRNTARYLPRLIIDHKLGENCRKTDLEAAMRKLLVAGRFKVGPVGTYGNRSSQKNGLILIE